MTDFSFVSKRSNIITVEWQSLIESLQSPDAAERSQAILAIGHQRETRAINHLVRILCTDPDLNVQEDTTWSLVRMGSDAVDALLAALNDADPQARHNIIHTLGKIADVRALAALIQATTDTDQKVRYKAIYALGQIGHVDAIDALITALGDEIQTVSWMAREVLEGFGDRAVEPLVAALKTSPSDVQELIVSLLGDTGDERALLPLIDVLSASEDWEVRFAAIQALGQFGDERALAALLSLTEDHNPRISAIASAMVKRLGGS